VYVTSPPKIQSLELVEDGVGVGVGVVPGNVVELKLILFEEQLSVGVGVGVRVGVGVGVGVRVGVGVGVFPGQLNNDSKLNVSQTAGGVGVGQAPIVNSSHNSGQSDKQGFFPNNIQEPPKLVDKHQVPLTTLSK
jgi:hypothetical protein